jgi:urease
MTVQHALYGSFLPIPDASLFPLSPYNGPTPGAVVCLPQPIPLLPSRQRILLKVENTGDRPIQVGSHYPFLEVNPYLVFDRVKAYGTHLDIAAGTAVRFEPGETKTVGLVEVGGAKVLSGGSGLASGKMSEEIRGEIEGRVRERGFGHKEQEDVQSGPVPSMNREVVRLEIHLIDLLVLLGCLAACALLTTISTRRCLGRRRGIG